MERDVLRSIRSFSRARTNSQRGYALIAAIVLAVLYFLMIELLMIDASRELAEARRFRAKIVALTLAENGAELAAAAMLYRDDANVSAEDWQGTVTGEMRRTMTSPGAYEIPFTIVGNAETKGLVKTKANVYVQGRILGNQIRIQYTMHSQ
jgi:hypothetical protein